MQLQNENYSLRRSTNRNSKLINRDQEKKTTKKKKPKGSDDDDEGNSKKKTGFHTPMVLSEPLAALLGTQEVFLSFFLSFFFCFFFSNKK